MLKMYSISRTGTPSEIVLREQGIYTTWSVIYPHNGPLLQRHDGYHPGLFSELDECDSHRNGRREPIVVNINRQHIHGQREAAQNPPR